ncbi:bifunctional monothiol glutaredoxin-S16, chloroplastic [Abrus precatorius]|uniref:Bifunctional monothiol glutaredoxin-S16, chloroplastic n=1 Tax=Abrus precatorius TaxID=3816 RepID=A0A8B8JY84_ABRPR|nr:bifunctional monothiol glutaredoxin-S16, chloroplastic [Abrus precatorius]
MATFNLSSMHTLSFHRLFSSFPLSTPTLSFNLQPKPCVNPHPISLKPYNSEKLRTRVVALAVKNLGETESVTVSPENDGPAGELPSGAGVYAVYDKNGELQFIGLSRNIAASVSTHWKSVPELCGSVKAGIVDEPDREALTQAWKSWMEEYIKVSGKVPPGNESGNATWVRQAPKRKPDLRLTPGRHMQLTVPLEDLIDKLVKENKVVAFIKGSRSAPLCGFSQRVVAILENEGVDYESVNVLDEEYNYGLRETLKKYSNWPTFPQIFLDGELVGGCDILTSMYEKGELATVFKK